MRGATKLMEEIKARFPADLDYVTALDTTLAVSAGIREIVKTLVEALLLVVLVVFIFLQGFRATLIPLLAVPVALVGAFMVFPLLGFSIRSEEHTSELQSRLHLVCRLLLEKKKKVDAREFERSSTHDTACVLIQSRNFIAAIEEAAASATFARKHNANNAIAIAEDLAPVSN